MVLAGPGCLKELEAYTAGSYVVPVKSPRDVWAAFVMAECFRRNNRFDTASKFIDAISESGIAKDDESTLSAVSRHKKKLDALDNSPISDDLIAQSPPKIKLNHATPPASSPPSLLKQGFNFAWAITNWAASGFKTRNEDAINERLAICRACPELVNDQCQKCGCACVESNRLINKLALATEKCPLGKWE